MEKENSKLTEHIRFEMIQMKTKREGKFTFQQHITASLDEMVEETRLF